MTIQRAGSHLSRPSGESSKIVPTLTENCFLQPLHFQIRRVLRKEGSPALQRGQVTPLGQRSLATKARLTSASEKNLTASSRVWGRWVAVSMEVMYQESGGVSSTLRQKPSRRFESAPTASSHRCEIHDDFLYFIFGNLDKRQVGRLARDRLLVVLRVGFEPISYF